MASFAVEVYKVKVEPHHNADALELAVIGDYRSIIRKGQFKDGDLVAYIPEQSIVPDDLLTEMGLTGRLAGPNKNRVKAIKLRGVVSQGLVYPAKAEWTEGQNVTEDLRIQKYEPPIPAQFRGEQASSPIALKYDFDNIKKYPNVIQDGEEVVMTEKIHGTFFTIGITTEVDLKSLDGLTDGYFIVSSKGLISKGIYIKDNEANANNTYIRAAKQFQLGTKLMDIIYFLIREGHLPPETKGNAWLMGEVYGRSVQKNNGIEGYGMSEGTLGFRAFDIQIDGSFVDYDAFKAACDHVGIDTVPLLYRGPFSKETLQKYTSGTETVSGNSLHIREGTVVKPVKERTEHRVGRVIFKSVSDEYLMKSDGEEAQ